jgi:hypothetical protein
MQSLITVTKRRKNCRNGKVFRASLKGHIVSGNVVAIERHNLTLHGIPLGLPLWVTGMEGKS